MIPKSLAARAALRPIVCLFLAAVIGACGGSSGPPIETVVRGWVSAEEGISDAGLTFYTTEGTKVGDSASPTSSTGSFVARIQGLPRDFRVVAQGGMSAGEPSQALFAAEYRQYRPDSGPIRVNPLTTMVSRYLQRHPSATLDESTAAVNRFLVLPDSFDSASGITPRNKYFSVSNFMAAASENGGVNSYMDSLVSQMDSGAVQAFPPEQALPRSVASALALALAQGAASYVGGEVTGWALAQTGLWDNKDATQQAVSNMESTLNNLLSEVAEIKFELGEIKAQLNLQSYTERVENNGPIIDAIEDLSGRLAAYAISPLKGERDEILKLISEKILQNTTTLHKMQVGVAGTQPLMEVWGKIAQGSTRFVYSETYNPKVQTQFEYFRQLQLMQLLLQVEYWHAKGEGGPAANGDTNAHPNTDKALKNYHDNILAQLKLLRTLPPDTVADTVVVLTDDATGLQYRLLYAASGSIQIGTETFPRRMGRIDFDDLLTKFPGWRKPTQGEVLFTFPFPRSDCQAWGTGQAYLYANGWPRLMGELALGTADNVYPDGQAYVRHYLTKACTWDWSEEDGRFDWRFGVNVAWPGYQPGENLMADWLAVRTLPGTGLYDYLWTLH